MAIRKVWRSGKPDGIDCVERMRARGMKGVVESMGKWVNGYVK